MGASLDVEQLWLTDVVNMELSAGKLALYDGIALQSLESENNVFCAALLGCDLR
jgi:hypothetical protein